MMQNLIQQPQNLTRIGSHRKDVLTDVTATSPLADLSKVISQ